MVRLGVMAVVLLALGVCFLLVMSEFTTFHLSGMRSVGSELAVLYESVGAHLQRNRGITVKRSTERCTQAHCAPYFLNWFDRIDW